MSRSGFFVTFEGIEGSGKSSQAQRLVQHLKDQGYPVQFVREPGGTPLGESVRRILADPDLDITPLSEVFLLSASRSQLVEQYIRPQLGEGSIVVCDRFTDSTMAYQGYGRRVHPTHIREVADMCTWGVRPDLTILLDIDPEKGMGRVRTRSVETLTRMDRLENMDMEFHERVREGYLEIAAEEPFRFRVFDGMMPVEVLAKKIADCVMREVTRVVPHPGRLTFDRTSLE